MLFVKNWDAGTFKINGCMYFGVLAHLRLYEDGIKEGKYVLRHRDTVVVSTTGCGLDGPDFEPGEGKRFFLLNIHLDHHWGPPLLFYNDNPDSFWWVKRSDCLVDFTPPSGAEA